MATESNADTRTTSLFRRLIAFLRGDIEAAEPIQKAEHPSVPWITAARDDPEKAAYALDATKRGAEAAQASVKQIQERASGLLGTILLLFPLAMTVTLIVLPRPKLVVPGWIAFALFVIVDGLLVLAATLAFLASGLHRAGGLNPARYRDKDGIPASADTTLTQLKTIEADAWYYATEIAFEVGHRKAQDIFGARRAIVCALIVAVLAAPFLAWAKVNEKPAPLTSCAHHGRRPAHTMNHPVQPSKECLRSR